jgi:hypothetical protein
LTINDKAQNSGLVDKCRLAVNKALATEFEGAVVVAIGMANGVTKKRAFQDALRTLSEDEVPESILQADLLAHAKAQTKAAQTKARTTPAAIAAIADAPVVAGRTSASSASAEPRVL